MDHDPGDDRERMTRRRKRRAKPTLVAEIIRGALPNRRVAARIEQAHIVLQWEHLVGPQLARVAQATSVTPDGTLFVDVQSSAWMNELQLMRSTILDAVNRDRRFGTIKDIRWRLASRGMRHTPTRDAS